MAVNDRLQALNVLTKVIVQRQALTHALKEHESSSFTKELCFGVCRQYYRLEAILNALMTKKTKNTTLKLCLLLGLYQLQYTRKADYAVVQESVSMLNSLRLSWAKGLMNAVLRNFERSRDEILSSLTSNPSYAFGQQAWMLTQWKNDWPKHWEDIAAAQDAHPPMSLRVNQKKISTQAYLETLAKNNIMAQTHPIVSSALILETPCAVDNLPGFAQGWVSVQDVAAQLAAQLLEVDENTKVLDACCAPGGKTCHILEQEHPPKHCLAIDVDARRIKKVSDNLQRLQLHAHLQVADATQPEQWWDGVQFDRILLDAPCTASGVMRRQPDIRILRTKEDVQAAVAIQHQLLHALWPLLKPGGQLLYATCSIFKVENEAQIAQFVDAHQDAASVSLCFDVGHKTDNGWQFLPGEASMDGFFYAQIVKKM